MDKDTDIPWIVRVNPERAYDMGGAVIGDHIQTEKVVYKTDRPLNITLTTDSEEITESPRWITLSDKDVAAIWSAGNKDAINLLFSKEGEEVFGHISEKVGHIVTKDEISDYAFINESKNQFVWFAPENHTPTTYELSYVTDASKADSNVLTNSAGAGWKQWTSGTVIGSFLQEVKIEKTNDGVYQEGENYFVDWTITLEVPEGRNAIPDAFLYDELPYHNESDAYDRLVGLDVQALDYNQLKADEMGYLATIAKPAFKISTTSSDEKVKEVVDKAIARLGHPVLGLSTLDFRVYEQDDTLRGQFPIDNGGEQYDNQRMTPVRFSIWLGELPDTLNGKGGYTITVTYTTQVDPKLVSELNGRTYGINNAALEQRSGDSDAFLTEAYSPYWIDHSTAQNVLDKSVIDFDSDTNIVTYQVNINPEADLEATSGAEYILKDVLDLPGAQFIKNSFQLSFLGTVDKASAAFTWDNSEKTVLWRADGGKVDLPDDQSNAMKSMVENDVENSSSGSGNFTFTLTNNYNSLALAAPEEAIGKLAPMVLTYQVELPERAVAPEKETITNSVTLSMKSGENEPVLLDGVKTTFDYTTALHKHLSAAPDGANGYTATFVINVDKKVDEWKNMGGTFTVSDEMSKSLVVDITSIKVYGIKSDGDEEELNVDDYTSSYDDRSSETSNFLSVTITDSDSYDKYRIEYDTKVQGEIGDTVEYDNAANVEGTEIKSEIIEKDVYIQKQTGGVDETYYEVKLLKFDAQNTAVKLKATFTLYAYEDGEWTEKLTDLTTNDNGELVLNNTIYKDLNLGPNTWYKLVETEAPFGGYLKGTTYFRIGQMEEDETKPGEIGSYTTISLKGGTHQIPNYKASLRLHKMDEEKGITSSLSGAEFGLYGDPGCTGELLSEAKEEHTKGIYSFELADLTAGTSYYLKETKAPDGYNLPDTVYTVTFDEEGNVTLTNGDEIVSKDGIGAYLIPNKCGYELPKTGGHGRTWYTLAGLLLCSAAYFMYKRYLNRKGESDFTL